MKNLRILLLSIFSLLRISGIYSQSKNIDFVSDLNSTTSINCSDYFEQLIYIALNTNTNSLVDKFPVINIIDSNIVVQTFANCLVFDLKTGKFKQTISKRGRGPGEYRRTLKIVDYESRTVFFQAWGNYIYEYNIDGSLLRTIDIPFVNGDFNKPSIPTEYGISENLLISYYCNIDGKEEKLLVGVDKENSEINFIINNANLYQGKSQRLSTNEALFYHFNKQLLFKEMYNDTIFEIKDQKLKPHLILNTGKYHFPYEKKWEYNPTKDEYIFPHQIFETKGNLYFHFFYKRQQLLGIYDKTKKSIAITEVDKGMINDIDNFINFNPVNSGPSCELIGIIDAYKLRAWFDENPEKINKLPPHLKKLSSVKDTDNPIVVIAKLK